LCGYTLDNLSLMALTVATGFVVDDAIVVLENVSRHIEEGKSPFAAALLGGQPTAAMVNGQIASASGVSSPAVLVDPVPVDQATLSTTVIADGLVSKAQLCAGLPPTSPCA